MRRLEINRADDQGLVAQGIEFGSGTVALEWASEPGAVTNLPNVEALVRLTDHGDPVVVKYLDEEMTCDGP